MTSAAVGEGWRISGEVANPDQKRCSRCRAVKPVDEFHYKNKSAGTRSNWCRLCCRRYKNSPAGHAARARMNKRAKARYRTDEAYRAKKLATSKAHYEGLSAAELKIFKLRQRMFDLRESVELHQRLAAEQESKLVDAGQQLARLLAKRNPTQKGAVSPAQ